MSSKTSSKPSSKPASKSARPSARTSIAVQGARVHNLKNISLEVPRDKLIVVTGLSGSGKSSLAFDTIYAEGQRRYMESLSSYAKRFIAQGKVLKLGKRQIFCSAEVYGDSVADQRLLASGEAILMTGS